MGRPVYPFRCRRWKCPGCGRFNGRRLIKAFGEQARQHSLQRLLTLTLDPTRVDPQILTSQYLMTVWAKWRIYLARRYGRRVVYLWIKERGSKGGLHLRVLIDRYLPQKCISASWSAVGGGPVVDIRYVDLHRVSASLYLRN
jgi:hypothetical protein